jgi:hypothetical protein
LIVQCVSFGTTWWFRSKTDETTGALLLSKSAYFNTSAFPRGSKKMDWLDRSKGFVRINANATVFSEPSEILQAIFVTPGVERFMDSSRLSAGNNCANTRGRPNSDEPGRMGGRMQQEQIASVTRGRVATPQGRLTISGERDIPLLELIRDCTFITRSQIEQLSRVPGAVRGFSKTESYRSRTRRLSRLIEIQQLTTHGQMLPYKGIVYSIGRAGLATLEVLGNGLLNITSGSDVLSKIDRSRTTWESTEREFNYRRHSISENGGAIGYYSLTTSVRIHRQ